MIRKWIQRPAEPTVLVHKGAIGTKLFPLYTTTPGINENIAFSPIAYSSVLTNWRGPHLTADELRPHEMRPHALSIIYFMDEFMHIFLLRPHCGHFRIRVFRFMRQTVYYYYYYYYFVFTLWLTAKLPFYPPIFIQFGYTLS